MAEPTPPTQSSQRLMAALPTFAIPMVYFNGFNAGLSNSEITCILTHDNQAAIKAVMPLSVAKSLAKALGDMVGKYEEATHTKVLSMEELRPLLGTLIK